MKEITINNEGVCPICGAYDDFTWGGSEIDGDNLYYDLTCNKCGAKICERYILEYHSTTGLTD